MFYCVKDQLRSPRHLFPEIKFKKGATKNVMSCNITCTLSCSFLAHGMLNSFPVFDYFKIKESNDKNGA